VYFRVSIVITALKIGKKILRKMEREALDWAGTEEVVLRNS